MRSSCGCWKRSRGFPCSTIVPSAMNTTCCGPHGEGTRDGDALLLPARQACRVGVALVKKSDLSEKFLRRRQDFLALHALDLDRRLQQILQHRHVREEVELLKDHAHLQQKGAALPARSVLRMTVLVLRSEEVPINLDRTLVDVLKPIDAAQQRRLA